MSKTLKEIDEDVLVRIKEVHRLAQRWFGKAQLAHEDGRLDDAYFSSVKDTKSLIDQRLHDIFEDVMTEQQIQDHVADINQEMLKIFGEKKE